jgi:hypothetical protein
MFNENLADFELYGALHIGYTFWLLEQFAAIGYQVLQPQRFDNARTDVKGYFSLTVCKDSIERVLARAGPPPSPE